MKEDTEQNCTERARQRDLGVIAGLYRLYWRAALGMQLVDNPVPAATGGVLNSLPGLPGGFCAAFVVIHFEPWAAAQSGRVVELADIPRFDFTKRGKAIEFKRGPFAHLSLA